MRKTTFLACLALAVQTPCFAATSLPPNSNVLRLDMFDKRCTIKAAGDAEMREHTIVYLRHLKEMIANTDRWQAFMSSRKWNHSLTMAEQMTAKEAARFEVLRQETSAGLLTTLLEDKRTRDLRVFIAGAATVKQLALTNKAPTNESSDEFKIAAILVAGRDAFKLKDEDAAPLLSPSGKCSFEKAILAEAMRSFDVDATTKQMSEAETTLNALAQKYGKPIKLESLNPNEQKDFQRSLAVTEQAHSRLGYYFDLLLLARLEQVSKLQRDVRRQSRIEAPGNMDHLNVVWNEWVKQGRISDGQNELSKVMNYINEVIPSEFSKDAEKHRPKRNP